MMNKRELMIYTHDGIFHADEICAVALLQHYLHTKTNLVRTRDKKKLEIASKNTDVFVIDVGGIYRADNLNFDHHQDGGLPASNMLIFKFLKEQGYLNTEVAEELEPFLLGISDMDVNTDYAINNWRVFNNKEKYRNVSNIISGFNTDPNHDSRQYLSFYKALNIMSQVLENEIKGAEQRVREQKMLKDAELINGRVLIFDEYCSIWKDKRKSAFNMAIMPHTQGWQIVTRDSDNFPLPTVKNASNMIFMHHGHFLAVFKEKKAVVEYALLQL